MKMRWRQVLAAAAVYVAAGCDAGQTLAPEDPGIAITDKETVVLFTKGYNNLYEGLVVPSFEDEDAIPAAYKNPRVYEAVPVVKFSPNGSKIAIVSKTDYFGNIYSEELNVTIQGPVSNFSVQPLRSAAARFLPSRSWHNTNPIEQAMAGTCGHIANLVGTHTATVGLNISLHVGSSGGAVNWVASATMPSGTSDRQNECGCGEGGDDDLPEPESIPGVGMPVPTTEVVTGEFFRTVDLTAAQEFVNREYASGKKAGGRKSFDPVEFSLRADLDAMTISSCGGGGGGGDDDEPDCYTYVVDHYWYYPDTGAIEYRYSTYETICEET